MRHVSKTLTRLALTLAVLWTIGAAAAEAANSGFVTAQGGEFRLNGQLFRFVSTNSYYMIDAGTYNSPAHTDDTMAMAQSLGFTVLRTWGFLDGPNVGVALQPEAGVYDESAFRAMDYVLYKADLAGIRLLITLVDYWPPWGGMPQYVQWCAPGEAVDVFYTNASCRQLYKNYVSYVLNRVNTYNGRAYKDDPTVLGWELANEPRSGDRTGSIVRQWADEMSAYVKSIDANHLVGLGEEGFDTTASGYSPVSSYNSQGWLFDGSEGTSFTANTALPNIDFASIHVYPGTWNFPAAAGATWITDHIRIARQLGKPLIVGEFGYPGVPWNVYKPWMDAFEAEKGAGALIWEIICATVCGNYGGSLAAAYPSSSPVPPGMAQFAALANADSGTSPLAVTFLVAPTSVTPSSALTGQAVAVSTQVTASASMTGIVVDVEVYNASNVRVGQTSFTGQTFAAGVARSFNWTWTGSSTAGTFTVKVGVSSADRSTTYERDDAAASITVLTPPSFTVTSTTVSPSLITRGRTTRITSNVKATKAASGIQIDLELYNSGGSKVAQSICTKSFTAGQTQSCVWTYAVPGTLPAGTYTVKVGVFSANWATLYIWVNKAASLVVK